MLPRVQLVTCDRVKDYYGITSGLFNSATFVADFLTEEGYDAKITPIVDSNSIDRVVTEFNPDVVIIEALWVPPYKFRELLSIPRHQKRKWIVRIHSKAPFLANEGIASRWIKEYTKIENPGLIIAPNSKELTEQLHIAFPEGRYAYLPNIYHFKDVEVPIKIEDPDWISIGSFGAIRPMKNTYEQALAAIEFVESKGKRLQFHINSSRLEQSGGNVLTNLISLFECSPHRLVQHSWYNHVDFMKAASQMDIGMQISFSESFNIVAADFVNVKVPIIVSPDIGWMPWFLKSSPTSSRQMVRKLNIAYRWKKVATFFQTIFLRIYNTKAKLTWLAIIK